MRPDEAIFHAHLEEAPFQAGADAGRWGLLGTSADIAWPHPVIWVEADRETMHAGRVYLRFDASGYPQSAPTACPWDSEKNCRLDPAAWPNGPGNVSKVFNPGWNNGTALYAPCDRVAMAGHESWQPQFPSVWWQPSFNIAVYLDFIHSCLNRSKYACATE